MNRVSTTLCVALALMLICSCHNNPYQQGKRMYIELCSNCHMEDGSGLVGNIPSLNSRLSSLSTLDQVCIVKNGINADSLGMAMNVMPSFDRLSDVQITNILNFINAEWNSEFNEMSLNTTKEILTSCQ